jgi:hypothetical protein
MEPYKRDFFIARIRAGYVSVKMDGQRFLVGNPDKHIALCSQELYLEAYEKAEDEGLLTDEELLDWLVRQGIWSEENEKNYQKVVPEHIEYWKIELFNSSLKSNTRKTIRKYLKAAKDEYERLGRIRHYYDYTTIDGYATYVKNMYIISNSTTLDNQLVDWQQYNLATLMSKYHHELLSPEDVRELARTAPWTGLWSVLKSTGRIFEGDLTIEQQSLLSWSIMYDRIRESHDCPSDSVIDDDDMLDGWLLVQKRKREAEKNKQEIESSLSDKMRNADDVFIMAETAADAQKIDMLNPQHAKRIKSQRLQHVKEQGLVREQEFKDVQQQRSMDMQRAYIQRVKGR